MTPLCPATSAAPHAPSTAPLYCEQSYKQLLSVGYLRLVHCIARAAAILVGIVNEKVHVYVVLRSQTHALP